MMTFGAFIYTPGHNKGRKITVHAPSWDSVVTVVKRQLLTDEEIRGIWLDIP